MLLRGGLPFGPIVRYQSGQKKLVNPSIDIQPFRSGVLRQSFVLRGKYGFLLKGREHLINKKENYGQLRQIQHEDFRQYMNGFE